MPLINRELSGNVLLINRELSGNVLLINKKLVELEDDARCAFLPRLTELEDDIECTSLLKLTKSMKKPSNLTRIRKEKPYCSISHSLTCFVKLVRWPRFYFVEGLADLTDGLAISKAKSRKKKDAIGFSG